MITYFTGIVLTFIMLLLFPNSAFLGNKTLIFAIMLVYSAVYFLFTVTQIVDYVKSKFTCLIAGCIGLFFSVNLIFWLLHGSLSVVFTVESLLVILLPAAATYLFKAESGNFHWVDVFTFLVIFLVVELKLLRVPLVHYAGYISFDGTFLIAVLLLLFLFRGYREINLGFEVEVKNWRVWLETLVLTALLLAIDLAVGISLRFISLKGWEINLKELSYTAIFMFLYASMAEEIFFRGLIYNYLAQLLKKTGITVPLLLSTFIFGCTHLNNGGLSMFILASIAGLFYGVTYLRTKSLFCAALMHTIVNLVWKLWFVTNLK